MRKYLILLSLLFCVARVKAQCPLSTGNWSCTSIAVFQSGTGITSVTTNVITPVTNGDTIIATSSSCASVTCTVNSPQNITITDNAGGANSYTCPISNPAVSFGTFFAGAVTCYVCRSVAGPTQFTATNSNTVNGSYTRLVVTIWHNSSGQVPTSCLDQTSTATFTSGSGTSASIATTSNTTANNDLIYSAVDVGGGPSVNNSFVITQQTSDTVLSTEAKNGATPGSYPTGWTFPSGPWFGDELAIFAPVTPTTSVPRHHGTFIALKPHHYRLPWIIRRNKLRIETI